MKGAATCLGAVQRQLAAYGSWLSVPELAAATGWHVARVEEAIAELVISQRVRYSDRMQAYRLAGTRMALAAARDLFRAPPGHGLSVCIAPDPDNAEKARAGFAELQPDGGAVMWEVEFPNPGPMGLVALAKAQREQFLAARNAKKAA